MNLSTLGELDKAIREHSHEREESEPVEGILQEFLYPNS
jgi:hypothetical protein